MSNGAGFFYLERFQITMFGGLYGRQKRDQLWPHEYFFWLCFPVDMLLAFVSCFGICTRPLDAAAPGQFGPHDPNVARAARGRGGSGRIGCWVA